MKKQLLLDKSKIKGQVTKDTGTTIVVLSILIFLGLIIASFYNNEEAILVLSSSALFGGVLIGIVIHALGQIMLNTGLTALINEERARKKYMYIKD